MSRYLPTYCFDTRFTLNIEQNVWIGWIKHSVGFWMEICTTVSGQERMNNEVQWDNKNFKMVLNTLNYHFNR